MQLQTLIQSLNRTDFDTPVYIQMYQRHPLTNIFVRDGKIAFYAAPISARMIPMTVHNVLYELEGLQSIMTEGVKNTVECCISPMLDRFITEVSVTKDEVVLKWNPDSDQGNN